MVRHALALAFVVLGGNAVAQESVQPWEEYDKLIRSRTSVTTLGPTLFGDAVDLASGSLSFSVTDISIPGNSSLPVALTRTYKATRHNGYTETNSDVVIGSIADAAMTDWDIDTPSLSGVFATNWNSARCTSTLPPPSVNIGGTIFAADDYWQGNHANMPGGGEMLVADAGAPAPATGGPYPWMTSSFTYFSCLPSIQNGPGEGFLAVAPDGTKYRFDWLAQFYEPGLKGADGAYVANRRRNVLYATRVEDRFGNWVTYSYSNAWNAPGRLTAITASDGRKITLQYDAHGHVASASNGQQTWAYSYKYPSPTTGTLTTVVLPDNSRWTLDFQALSAAKFRYIKVPASQQETYRSCMNPGDIFDGGPVAGTVTHPSGATGQFTVEPVRFGRSNVPLLCANYQSVGNNPNDDVAVYALAWDAYTVTAKQVSGPGLTPAQWNYAYGSTISYFYPASGNGMPVCGSSDGCRTPQCTSDSCAGTAVTVVTGPDGRWERYTFGNSYRYNEGKLLKVETGTGPDAILRSDTLSYDLAQSGRPFATPIGHSPQPRGDGFTAEYLRPQTGQTIAQDGATFGQTVTGFDVFARPTGTRKASSLGYVKTDAVEYHDDTAQWVIGQTRKQINADDGTVMAQTDYDPTTDLPIRQYRFGKLQHTLSYNTDGTLATAKDGRNDTTALSNWQRGIPGRIQYADGTVESAAVNNVGWITATTDENGFTTSYTYDAMGRISQVTPPAGDLPAAAPTTFAFQPATSATWGLPAGHWRRTTVTGRYRQEQYFDALWRPVFEIETDTAVAGGTPRYRSRRYDTQGHEVFASYPASTASAYDSLTQGTRTQYDALDRVTRTEQDSELGVLATTTAYLSGFGRRITNPRGQSTLQLFQAYDEPTYDAPVGQDAPEGVSTTIVRDRYLKPVEVTRSGPGG